MLSLHFSLLLTSLVALLLFYLQPEWPLSRVNRELIIWPVTLALLWGYWQGYKQLKTRPLPLQTLLVGAGLLAVIAAAIPPFHSTDVFGYINRGWQQWHYGLNPYIYTVDHIPGWEHDPMITNHWVNNPSPYGFVYLQIAKGLTALGGGNPAVTLAVFKAFNVLVYALTIAMIAIVTRRFLSPNDPHALSRAVYLFAYNPLILTHGLSNAHNDLIMGLLSAIGLMLGFFGAFWAVLPALTAATLVKYGSAVLLPFSALFVWKSGGWRALALGVGLAALLAGISGWPYLQHPEQIHWQAIERNAGDIGKQFGRHGAGVKQGHQFIDHQSLVIVVYRIQCDGQFL